MGRLSQQVVTDTGGGNLQRDLTYDQRGGLSKVSDPYRSGPDPTKYETNYIFVRPSYQIILYADGSRDDIGRGPDLTQISNSFSGSRYLWHKEDGKISSVQLEDPETGLMSHSAQATLTMPWAG